MARKRIRKKKETWIETMWRPAIAWSYLVICVFDFFIAPIINAVFQSTLYPDMPYLAWKPITLAEGGLYHLSMMAIVGVTAFTRGKEKITRIENGVETVEEVPEETEEEVK